MVEINFEVDTEAASDSSFGPITPGDYLGRIIAVDQKTSSSGNEYLSVEIQTDKGRVWDNLNLWHSNSKAVDIAKRKLSEIGIAVGLGVIKDTEQLLAKELTVKIGLRKDDPTKNEVITYASASAADLPATAASAPPPVAAPSSNSQAAWNG